MTKPPRRIPLAIDVFGGLLVLVGAAAGVAQYLAPEKTFANLPELGPAIQNVAWQVGSRSIAQAAVLLLALVVRDKRALALVFLMRAITELQDMSIALRTGIAPAPPLAIVFVFVALFIVPEIVAARWLWRAARAPAA